MGMSKSTTDRMSRAISIFSAMKETFHLPSPNSLTVEIIALHSLSLTFVIQPNRSQPPSIPQMIRREGIPGSNPRTGGKRPRLK